MVADPFSSNLDSSYSNRIGLSLVSWIAPSFIWADLIYSNISIFFPPPTSLNCAGAL